MPGILVRIWIVGQYLRWLLDHILKKFAKKIEETIMFMELIIKTAELSIKTAELILIPRNKH